MESLSGVSFLTSKIADKTLEQLENEGIFVFPEILRDADDITKDQMILQSVNNYYLSSNVMGFMGLGDEKGRYSISASVRLLPAAER